MIGWVLMQHMLRKATGFSWADILAPQVPAVTCSPGLIALVGLGRSVIGQLWPVVQAWHRFLIPGSASGVAYLLFLRFSRFTEATSLVRETLTVISPRLDHLVKA